MSQDPTLPPTAVTMARRFRGFLPVVVDVETGGFNAGTDALLQIAAVIIDIDADGLLRRGETHAYHVKPFAGANIEPASLQVNKIDPFHPLRPAIDEHDAMHRIFRAVRTAIRAADCRRAILVGHNAWFDLSFLNAAATRTAIKRTRRDAIEEGQIILVPLSNDVFSQRHRQGVCYEQLNAGADGQEGSVTRFASALRCSAQPNAIAP